MRNVTRGVVLGAIVLMVIGGSIPASAKAHRTKEIYIDEGWFTLVFTDENDVTIPGAKASPRRWTPSASRSSPTSTRTGVAIKGVLHGNFFGTITNADGDTFRDHATFTETYDLVKGTTTVSGSATTTSWRARGQVFAEVGHKITIDATGEVSFQAGQDDFVQQGMEGICAALS